MMWIKGDSVGTSTFNDLPGAVLNVLRYKSERTQIQFPEQAKL